MQMFGNMQGSGGTQVQTQAQPQVQTQYQQPPQQQPVQQQYQPPVQQPQQQYQQQAPVQQQQYQQPVQQPMQQPVQQPVQTVYGQPQQQVQQPVQAPSVGTSNDTVQQVEKFVSSAGLKVEEVRQEFQQLGGITESTKRTLAAKHGEGTANLIVQSMQSIHAQTQATLTATNNAIYSQVEQAFNGIATQGQTGQQSWNELSAWAKEALPVEQRTALNEMLKVGGVQAQMAVDTMINSFKQANGVGQTGDLINGEQGNGGKAPVGVDGMTVAEYSKQLDTLVQKYGYDSPQVTQLNAQRDAARQRGIN